MSSNGACRDDTSLIHRLNTKGLRPAVHSVYHASDDTTTMALRATESVSIGTLIRYVNECLPLSTCFVAQSDIDSIEEVHISMPNGSQAWKCALSCAYNHQTSRSFRLIAIVCVVMAMGIVVGSNM
jgi:hypothetical protein